MTNSINVFGQVIIYLQCEILTRLNNKNLTVIVTSCFFKQQKMLKLFFVVILILIVWIERICFRWNVSFWTIWSIIDHCKVIMSNNKIINHQNAISYTNDHNRIYDTY